LINHSFTMSLQHILKDFFSLIYPPACEACSEKLYGGEELLCAVCWFSLPKTGFHAGKENPLTRLFWGRVSIETGTALFYYTKGGKVQKLVHRLKYKGGTDLGFFLGRQLGLVLSKTDLYSSIDYIVPVPLHRKRLRKRGFNQSEVIGMGLSSVMGIPVNPGILFKGSSTQSQTRKRRFMRWENVESAFEVSPGQDLKDMRLLLVDDVITTGATLEACASKLTEKGARVWIATIAVTV